MTDKRDKMNVALVTGASSGFGQLIAQELSQAGYHVFGTSRRERTEQAFEMVVLDVRSDESVRRCVDEVLSKAGQIDLLVNNAGAGHVSLIEETSIEQAQAQMDTNFFGAVRMTQAVLPTMRAQRSGQIINISSLAGLLGVPGQAFYAASKHALEGYTESLRYEVEPFEIKVSLIEPGFFKTNFHHSLDQAEQKILDYNEVRAGIVASIKVSIEEGDDPRKVAEVVAQVAQEESPQLRYRIGQDARWIPRLRTMLPDSAFAFGMRRTFNLSSQ